MRNYRKKGVQQMEPWSPDIDMKGVSVSDADRQGGSPTFGDMIAVNKNDCNDRWLVAHKFFIDNYESAE